MISTAKDYAKTLRELNIAANIVGQADDIFTAVPQIAEEFANPSISLASKHNVIEKVLPLQIRDFLKLLCDNSDTGLWKDIVKAYREAAPERKGEFVVTLKYVTAPDDEQLQGIKDFVAKQYNTTEFTFELEEDKTLGGGFVIQAGNDVFDWSTNGRMKQFREQLAKADIGATASTENIISILKSEIDNFELEAQDKEVGVVSYVGDGIANINGIDHAAYGEIVIFDCGVKGMVQDVRKDEIGCILFGRDTEIKEGSRVARTGKRAGIPVGEGFLGRIIDALGAPIDGAGPVKDNGYRPIEQPAPTIVDRKSVSVPMETGILAIDSMFPIGRGQRELIIGDRQTGKTSIAIDTILNQKGKDVVCVYVAIGQKASTIAKLVNTLKQHDAMDYTIIVSATASDPAPLQYIAPYSGTAMAEYFMHEGKDVLIVYDDLSKHAVAYRALSLLLERSPGREAYPGDVFYLHSRLLERSARLSADKGGGSITALPIIETQAGDISAYIPTNVISITDGQIFLETELFHSGVMPAVNPGVSVSRVGGNAQIKAMKKVAGTLKLIYSQYRELASFAQFGSDLDADTKARLEQGVRIVEVLKQNQNAPVPVEKQVAILYAVTKGILSKVAAEDVRAYEDGLYTWLDTDAEGAAVMQEISATGKLEADTEEKLKSALESYTENFINTRPAK